MCGIAGVYSSSGQLPEADVLQAAITRLRRRGPDDSGVWGDTHAALGQRRLAIIDLSVAGHQPMQSADGRYVIVFNGAIYNHPELRPLLNPMNGWRGTSDTETLLEAYRTWGTECLKKINGMFVFAIWDRAERTLFLARDRLGVKPLYYSWNDQRLAFASRPMAVRTLVAGSAEIDPAALRLYLELGFVPGSLSFFRQIRKLPPGHYALVSERGLRVVRYWDFRHLVPDRRLLTRPEPELVDELDELIKRAVRLRLLSDVPLGAFLSGGVDSALIVAAMQATGVAHPKAFTIGFTESDFDEGPAAAAIARHLGVEHVHETLSVDSLTELLPLYVDEFDEPFADSSAFPTMAVARLARHHVTVGLSGDGSDELFGGYHYYGLTERLLPITRWSPALKRAFGETLRHLPWHRAKLLAEALATETPAALFHYLRGIGKDYPALVSDDVLQSTAASESWFAQTAAGFAVDLSGAEIGMRLDTSYTLPELFLQKVDVATMAFSLEARCPFTDYQLVEWAMRLPLSYKLRNGQTKYLLKKVLCRYLPPEMVYRPKMGFAVPIGQWLRGPLRAWARELIYDDSLMSCVPLNKARVREIFRLQSSGARAAHPLLWSVLMLLCFVSRHVSNKALPHFPRMRAA